MPNTITVNFIECSPTPANGYNLKWRVAGSSDPYTDEGNYISSPAVFVDSLNPAGTCYEGFLQSDCTESGSSGTVLGNAIAWATVCEESGTAYTINLATPCSGIYSNYLIENGIIGDIVKVRATFIGLIAKIGGLFTRADLNITSPDGNSVFAQSGCYTDTSNHSFSISADTIITLTGTTAIVYTAAVVHNSSSSSSNVTVTIIEINGIPVSISASGCAGNSATGGTC